MHHHMAESLTVRIVRQLVQLEIPAASAAREGAFTIAEIIDPRLCSLCWRAQGLMLAGMLDHAEKGETWQTRSSPATRLPINMSVGWPSGGSMDEHLLS